MIKLKYKGRSFSNGRSLAQAVTRDVEREAEQRVRRAASAAGVRVKKTPKGLSVEGDPEKVRRFKQKLGL